MQLQGYQSMKRGYTLIEILVGITIIGILFAVGYASFRDFSRRQLLSGLGKGIQGDLRLSQSQALSGEKPADARCTGSNFLDGYNFLVNSASRSYTIQAKCTGGLVQIKNVTLPADVTISSPSPNPILFKVLGQGTNIPSGGSAVFTLTQISTASVFSITVTSSGEVK